MSEKVIDPEVVPKEQPETRVVVASNLASVVASVAQYAERRIASAIEWLEAHAGAVTAETLDAAKKLRTSVNYAEKDAADKRKEIQRAVADALAETIQPLVDAEKHAKSLSSQFKAAIDALDITPRLVAPHYVEIVCDQFQWSRITKALAKETAVAGSFCELDPKWVKIPKDLKRGEVPV